MNVVLWYKVYGACYMNTFRDDDVSSFAHNTNKKRKKQEKTKK